MALKASKSTLHTHKAPAIALERGVTDDDKRTGRDVDGTTVLKREANSSNWHRRK